ncbi:redoxin domain-containing protein [Lipingzhangella sp. LS1_29]|uniref:Redoxin domain-containing protein n=1 Tax=Lipingzhangella rawalii TaxID=2055835 RepID=A0ABU2H4C6_9ACTN|nr:redoxin domain-containing protein [Lipingzhangella rawalii]MDS1270164.1 redoxin domain-containing protein [Lipingzhangella rawalii]
MTTAARMRGAVAPALAVLLALSACGSAEEESPADAARATDEPDSQPDADAASNGEVPAALDFTSETLEGEPAEGAALLGEPAVLWFWTPWCTICRGEGPEIADAAERHAGDVAFLGVPGQGERAAMEEFVDDTGTDGIRHVVDEDGAIWSGFGVSGQPSFVFLEADGSHETVPGTLSPDDVDSRIAEITD